MTYSYGPKSKKVLKELHVDLQKVFVEAIKLIDISLFEGFRNKEMQNRYYEEGKSKIKFPNGKHNRKPSMAVDAGFYPIVWPDKRKPKTLAKWYYFGGIVIGTANALYAAGKIKHKIRWGGDWDMDHCFTDQKFDDLPHFEAYKP